MRITVPDALFQPSARALMHMTGPMLLGQVTGDPRVGNHSRRDLDTVRYGQSKSTTYQAVLDRDIDYFEPIAKWMATKKWQKQPSLGLPVAKPGSRKPRWIADPTEHMRIATAYVAHLFGNELGLHEHLTEGQFGGWTVPRKGAMPCEHPSATMVDHTAVYLFQGIRDGYDWGVTLDLKNAFGLLPRQAAIRVLRGLGVSKRTAENIWELASIDSEVTDRDGKTTRFRRPGLGVEQGSKLGGMILNLTLAPSLRYLERAHEVKVAAYLDDIYVLAETEETAREAFRALRQHLRSRGFTNVRPISAKRKGSKIIDIQREGLPVLRTYLISPKGPSRYEIKWSQRRLTYTWTRRFQENRWMTATTAELIRDSSAFAVSASWIRRNNLREPPTDMNSPTSWWREDLWMISFGSSDRDRGDQRDSAERLPVPNTWEAISVASTVHVRIEDAETRVAGPRSERSEAQRREVETTVDPVGREEVVEVPRVPDAADDAVRDGSGCTTCATHTTGRDYLPKNSTQRDLVEKKEDDLSLGPTDLVPGDPGPLSKGSQGLLHLNPMMFVDELLAGKKIRAGDNYKGWPLDLSILGPIRDLPRGKLKRGLADLVRVVATNNRAVVMVEAWDLVVVGLVDGLDGWERVQTDITPRGLQELTLRRVRARKRKREVSVQPPAEADMCILEVDLDEGVVHTLRGGRPVSVRTSMESPAMAIRRAEAVASAVDVLGGDLVACQMSAAPLLVPHLLWDTAGSNVGLARVVSRLTRSRDWGWAREGHWLIGRRRRPSTPRPSRLK